MLNSKLLVKKIFLLAAIAILIAAPLVSFAQTAPGEKVEDCPNILAAGGFSCALLRLFRNVSIWIGYLIGVVAAFFISIAASFIQVLVNAGTKVISNPLVTEGFKISLSVANLGFVLAIIVIAFTTMLRVSGYETKKLLRNLILAAVLVNFSFLIAGAILDFGNVFGNFFLTAAAPQSGNFSNFAANLANSTNLQKLASIKPLDTQSVGGALEKFGAAYVGLFVSTFATAVFMIFLVIIFCAIAFMLLARYVYLIILLILMPVAWLAWVFPGFSYLFSDWWKKFLHWTLFYPAVTFFLYLSIVSSQKVGQLVQSGLPQQVTQGASEIANVGTDVIGAFLQILVQVGILLGGLIAAQKLGIEGASAALGYAGKVKNWAIGATGKATGLPAAYRGARGAAVSAGGAAAGVAAAALSSKALSWIPGAKNVSANLYNAAAARKEAVAQFQKEEYSKDSNEALKVKFRTYTADPRKRAAITNEIVKRGLADQVDQKKLDSYLDDVKKLGATKDIEENAPHLAPKVADYERTLKEAQKRDPSITRESFKAGSPQFNQVAIQISMEKFRPGKTESLGAPAIEQVSQFFRKEHLERLAKEGDVSQLFAAAKAAAKLSSTKPDHPLVQFALNNPAMQQLSLEPQYAKDLKALKDITSAEAAQREIAEREKQRAEQARTEAARIAAGGKRRSGP